jgi:hypothetical protein
MSSSVPWPCPVCAELVDVGQQDCPHCHTSAAWVDWLRALDFSIRQLHYWSLSGGIDKEGYRTIVTACRSRREDMAKRAQRGEAAPAVATLPPPTQCWSCQAANRVVSRFCGSCGAVQNAPEVRLVRYHTFLIGEIAEHEKAGRLTKQEAQALLDETKRTLASVRQRLEEIRPG